MTTFTVTTSSDTGPGSLRGSIGAANVTPGANTITFDPSVTSVTLSSPLQPITGDVTFDDGQKLSDLLSASPNSTLNVGAGGIVRLAAGALEFDTTGAGQVVITDFTDLIGDFTHTGGTIIDHATFAVGNNTSGSLAGNVTLANGGNLTFSRSDAYAFSGDISGSGSVWYNGGGVLTLSGTNTYSSDTLIQVGTLKVMGGAAIPDASDVVIGTGNAFMVEAAETVGSLKDLSPGSTGTVTLDANLTIGGGDRDTTFSGAISGAGSLIKIGTGTQTLAGTNTFTGGTVISGGTLLLNGGSALTDNGGVTVNADGTLKLGAAETIGSLAGAGTVNLNGFALTLGQNDADTVFSGNVSGASYLVKTGAGTLTLSGANTNADTAGHQAVQVQAGTLVLDGGAAIADGALVTLNGGTLQLAADETVGAVNSTAGAVHLGAHTLTMAGVTGVLSVGLNAPIDGSGGLVKSGLLTLILSGANTYTGGTTINGGTLEISGGAALSDTGAVTVNAGGTLELDGGETIGSLAGAGAVNLNSFDLSLGQTDADTVFSGTISGAAELVKTGTGTLTLSGANTNIASDHSAIEVDAGTLKLDGGAAIADNGVVWLDGGQVELAADETLGAVLENLGAVGAAGDAVHLGAHTLTMAGFVGMGSASLGAPIDGTGGLVKSGSWQLTLTGANTYTGGTTIDGGTLVLSGGAALADAGAVTVNTGATLKLAADETIGSLAGAGTVNLNGFALTVGGNDADTTFSGDFMFPGPALVKTGAGTLTLSGAAAYTGDATITQGTLQIGDGLASGGITGNIVDNATLTFNHIAILSYFGDISGSGELVKTGSGVLTLSGHNTYTGDTTVTGGTLVILGGSALGEGGTVDVENGASLTVLDNETIGGLTGAGTVSLGGSTTSLVIDQASGTATFSGLIEGASGLVKLGAGTLILSGASTHTGTTTVTAGELRVTGSTPSAITVETGATLSGTGSVGAVSVQSGGALSPGMSPGVLSTGDLDLAAGATLHVQIAGTTSGQFDQVDVSGTVDLGGATLDLDFTGYTPAVGNSFVVIANDGSDAVTGTFDGLAEGARVALGNQQYVVSYHGGDGNDVTLTIASPPIEGPPPPPTPLDIVAAAGDVIGVDLTSAKAQAATVTLPGGQIIANPLLDLAHQATAIQAQYLAGQINPGQVKELLIDLAYGTKGVAAETYSFFTGGAPTTAGMAYLVNSDANPNDLTDGYYAGVSTENRYINFAVNLGALGQGKDAFQAAYGALTFEQAVAKAYDAVIGIELARSDGYDPTASEAYVVSQRSYFQALGGSDLGAKAAMVGYLMAVGVESHIGYLYEATHTFLDSQVQLVAQPTELAA